MPYHIIFENVTLFWIPPFASVFVFLFFILFYPMSDVSVPFKLIIYWFNSKNWIFMGEYLCLHLVTKHIWVHTHNFWWEIFPFSLEMNIYNILLLDEEPFQSFYYSNLVLVLPLDNLSFLVPPWMGRGAGWWGGHWKGQKRLFTKVFSALLCLWQAL